MECYYLDIGEESKVQELKEILDFIYKGNFDGKDIIFGSIGGIIGELLYLI